MDSECKDEFTCTTWDDVKGALGLRCMVVLLGKMFHSHCPTSLWDNNWIKKVKVKRNKCLDSRL